MLFVITLSLVSSPSYHVYYSRAILSCFHPVGLLLCAHIYHLPCPVCLIIVLMCAYGTVNTIQIGKQLPPNHTLHQSLARPHYLRACYFAVFPCCSYDNYATRMPDPNHALSR